MTIDAAMEGRSADFEQALAAQFTKVRGSDSQWALRIREQDMNEWLASRLPRWLEHQGASALECNRATRLRCLEDRLEIARENAWSVGVVALAPRAQSSTGTNANGTNIHGTNTHEVLAPTGATLGSLIIPTTLVRTFGPAELMHSLNKREFPLADGRRVRVMDLEVLPGEIRLALATEPAKK